MKYYEKLENMLKERFESCVIGAFKGVDDGKPFSWKRDPEIQSLVNGFGPVFTHALIDNIKTEYQSFLIEKFGEDDSRVQTLLSGLDIFLSREFNLTDYSHLQPRQVPDSFQLDPDEVSGIAIENPLEIIDLEELRGLYGPLGTRAYCHILHPQTFDNLKNTVALMRRGRRRVGTRTELAVEDYLIWKTGYTPKEI